MNDFIAEIDRELREDRRRALWERYGIYVIAAAIGIVGLVAGRQGYVAWQESIRSDAANAYLAALDRNDAPGAGDDSATVPDNAAPDNAALAALASKGGEGYPMLARFTLAAQSAAAGNNREAETAYLAIAEEDGVAQIYRDAALLLSVLHADKSTAREERMARLEPLAASGSESAWAFLAIEVLIGLALEAGDKESAGAYLARLESMENVPEDTAGRLAPIAGILNESGE